MIAARRPYGPRLIAPSDIKMKCAEMVPQNYLQAGTNYAKMWTDFNWVGWFKPQIDLGVANGANAVKIAISGYDIAEINGTAWPTRALMLSRMTAFLDYCRSVNCSVYLSMAGGELFGAADYAARVACMVQIAAWCDTIPDSPVCAIDLVNEVPFYGPARWNGGSNTAQMAADIGAFAASIRAVTTLPLTASVYLNNVGDWTGPIMAALAPIVDFHDGHPYYGIQGGSPASTPAASDVNALVGASWFKGHFLAGEVGVNQGVASATQTSFLNGIGALINHPKCWGGVLFGMADYDIVDGPLQQWGASDLNVQNPRSAILTPFRTTWPARA